jgi:hypothetical protein
MDSFTAGQGARAQEEWAAFRAGAPCQLNCEPTVEWPISAATLAGGQHQCTHGAGKQVEGRAVCCVVLCCAVLCCAVLCDVLCYALSSTLMTTLMDFFFSFLSFYYSFINPPTKPSLNFIFLFLLCGAVLCCAVLYQPLSEFYIPLSAVPQACTGRSRS